MAGSLARSILDPYYVHTRFWVLNSALLQTAMRSLEREDPARSTITTQNQQQPRKITSLAMSSHERPKKRAKSAMDDKASFLAVCEELRTFVLSELQPLYEMPDEAVKWIGDMFNYTVVGGTHLYQRLRSRVLLCAPHTMSC